MSTHQSEIKPCNRCGKTRPTKRDRSNYCIECRADKARPFANWMEYGACKDPNFEPDWWWPETADLDSGHTPVALSICRYCTVRDLCLDYAIQHKERHGIWGGLMPAARNAIAANQHRKVS